MRSFDLSHERDDTRAERDGARAAPLATRASTSPRGRAVLLAACLLVVANLPARANAEEGLAMVDVQAVIVRTPRLLRIDGGDAARRELDTLSERLSSLRERIRTPAAGASAADLRALEAEYDELSNVYQRKQVDYRRDLDTAQTEARERARSEVARVAARVARREGLAVVVDRDAVVFSDDRTPLRDLTELVIAELARSEGPVTPAPSAADPSPASTPSSPEGEGATPAPSGDPPPPTR